MPIYEYRCGRCDHEFETIQKISETVLTKCPECDQDSLKKKVSAAGFRLKGGGWYETDFKSGSKKNVTSSDSGGGSSDSGSTGGDSTGGGSTGGGSTGSDGASKADSKSAGKSATDSKSSSSSSGKQSSE